MSKHYINTNNLPPLALKKADKKAKAQEEIVLHIFRHKGPELTAYDVENIWRKNSNKIGKFPPPITSIRRAICRNIHLCITDKMTKGRYGAPVHYYRLIGVTKEEQLALF